MRQAVRFGMLHDKNRNAIEYRVGAAAFGTNQVGCFHLQIAVAGGAGKLSNCRGLQREGVLWHKHQESEID